MRKRLYFLLPDVASAKAVFKELLLAKVEERNIHTVAKPDTALGDLPEATIFQKSDTVHGAGLGLFVGALLGVAVGGLILLFPPSGLTVGVGVLFALALLGAVMGMWVSGMIGSSTPNTHLNAFENDIDRGSVLLIVDVPTERSDDISRLVRSQHPEAHVGTTDAAVASPSR